jgi:hypothetical protein
LTRPDVSAWSAPAWKEPIVSPVASDYQPSPQCVTCRLRELEQHGATGLLLDHCCAFAQLAAGRDVTDTEPNQVASSQLRVYGAVEESEIA